MDKGIITNEYHSPCVLLLGGFDGLHVGHKLLVDVAKSYNLPVGITTIYGGKGKSLFLPQEREKIFRAQGIDFIYPMNFTDQLKNTDKKDFLKDILQRFDAQVFVCGDDFRFGKGAQGTPEFLRNYAKISVRIPPMLCDNGQKIGTFSIKYHLERGEVERANRYLLQHFFITGKVENGRRVGRNMGFPTANVHYSDYKFPIKEGVYAVHACVDDVEYKGIANYGARPTFDNAEKKFEVHLIDFKGDLYGRELTVYIDEYLRDIKTFESPETLKNQLQQDVQRVRK